MNFKIRYVDGAVLEAPAELWASVRADGVDWVEADHVRFSGHSAYWLYPEDDDWVAGAASFYENVKTPEIVFHPDGSQEERPIEYVPDIEHRWIKLGWWWPGTEGKPVGEDLLP